jgi:hypothetical protein
MVKQNFTFVSENHVTILQYGHYDDPYIIDIFSFSSRFTVIRVSLMNTVLDNNCFMLYVSDLLLPAR